ncbi:MAG: M48 family metalloprotease [Planctomycetes bacterium]|nr:M48 family metalloprotease [Planctomycetota bacterium]
MHLLTILAFALIFWEAEQPELGQWLGNEGTLGTVLLTALPPIVLGITAFLIARRALRLIDSGTGSSNRAHQLHHRGGAVLRLAALAGFGLTVFATPWPEWLRVTEPALQIFGDLIVLSPFLASVLAIWLGMYPFERAVRDQVVLDPGEPADDGRLPWRLRSYLEFNLRHHFFIGAVPMTLILCGANLARGYEKALVARTGVDWAPDALLGLVAAGVFVLSPLMLRRIWKTAPLEDGPLRDRLETICRRIGLRCRDILVWHSDGVMINAAVMGLFARVRFVLLSDALLETMDTRQIEAVFGHEAGHVRHRHIQHFLVFAFVGWLAVVGMMELLARVAIEAEWDQAVSAVGIQTVSVVGAVLFWGIGFGWISRRFEREADLFAAKCVTPDVAQCREPCSVHLDEPAPPDVKNRVCATGASIFTSALDRVAVLNGIPHEENSWRHSSIGFRIRFLQSLAGDPARAATFARTLRRVKVVVPAAAVIGSAVFVYYWSVVSVPAILRLQQAAT